MTGPDTGLYVGTVESNKLDQDGCIGINIPALGGTFPARVAAFMAGNNRGLQFLPEERDQVLVAAVTGSDVKWAVIGSVWSRNEKPPAANSDGKNDRKIIKTRGGNEIRLIDKDGDETIEIVDKTGDNIISIKTKTNAIAISSKDGTISLEAKSVSIKATGGNVSIEGKEVRLND
jgi:uncharacterized protein involved in type VI secretion and phage assembly